MILTPNPYFVSFEDSQFTSMWQKKSVSSNLISNEFSKSETSIPKKIPKTSKSLSCINAKYFYVSNCKSNNSNFYFFWAFSFNFSSESNSFHISIEY